jgi:hypothetical protein
MADGCLFFVLVRVRRRGRDRARLYPGQARQVFGLRPAGLPKVLHRSQGAEFHDVPMTKQTRNQVVYDWLGGILS